jgi:hypothetical protein
VRGLGHSNTSEGNRIFVANSIVRRVPVLSGVEGLTSSKGRGHDVALLTNYLSLSLPRLCECMANLASLVSLQV